MSKAVAGWGGGAGRRECQRAHRKAGHKAECKARKQG